MPGDSLLHISDSMRTNSMRTYSASTYSTSTNSTPTYSTPTNSTPTYSASTYSTSTYSTPTYSASTYSASTDSMRTDTLREVTVRPLKTYHLNEMPLTGIKNDIKAPVSLGTVLEKLSPGIKDKILHPFAIQQRKKERRRKRALKNLDQYDLIKTDEDLLREAYEKQMNASSNP